MARTISDDFAPIIARAHARLTQVSVEEESDPPHRHGSDKSTTELTGEWTAEQFLDELDSLVESINNAERAKPYGLKPNPVP